MRKFVPRGKSLEKSLHFPLKEISFFTKIKLLSDRLQTSEQVEYC